MKLLRQYCDKLQESQQYDIHNLNNMFGLSTEINEQVLAEAKAMQSNFIKILCGATEKSSSSTQ